MQAVLHALAHASPASSRWRQQLLIGLVGALACLAALAVHSFLFAYPMLYGDDFQILIRSWTWSATETSLWDPANEHAMPLGRLTTWALVNVAGRPTALPRVATLQGPLAVLAGMGLVYLLVRRELGHPFYGLTAMVLFGVSSTYNQAVYWFSASFSILALDTILLALLAAQGWRLTGRARYLVGTVVWVALAPTWFASGILAGPLCALYLLLPEESLPDHAGLRPQEPNRARLTGRGLLRSTLLALLPLIGTVLFLAVSLPRTAERIMHLGHYQGKTAVEAFQPAVGLLYTQRALVDQLVPGLFGVGGVMCPIEWLPLALIGLIEAARRWWRLAPRRRLLLLGSGMILSSYLLVYSARSGWEYEQMAEWTRYNLLPHLGLVLFLCGGLPRWLDRGLLRTDGSLSGLQTAVLVLLTGVLVVCQFPRALFAEGWHLGGKADEHLAALQSGPLAWLKKTWTRLHNPWYDLQIQALGRIEEVDETCRRHHIPGETARVALEGGSAWTPAQLVALTAVAPGGGGLAAPAWGALAVNGRWPLWLEIPLCGYRENGWDFVRGSDDPHSDMTVDQAWHLLRR
jgi:hypothetical protein